MITWEPESTCTHLSVLLGTSEYIQVHASYLHCLWTLVGACDTVHCLSIGSECIWVKSGGMKLSGSSALAWTDLSKDAVKCLLQFLSLSDALSSISLVQPSPPLPCLLIETSWPPWSMIYSTSNALRLNKTLFNCIAFILSLYPIVKFSDMASVCSQDGWG